MTLTEKQIKKIEKLFNLKFTTIDKSFRIFERYDEELNKTYRLKIGSSIVIYEEITADKVERFFPIEEFIHFAKLLEKLKKVNNG